MFDFTKPSSGFTGKILSTKRLYRGRNAEQQPQQPSKTQSLQNVDEKKTLFDRNAYK